MKKKTFLKLIVLLSIISVSSVIPTARAKDNPKKASSKKGVFSQKPVKQQPLRPTTITPQQMNPHNSHEVTYFELVRPNPKAQELVIRFVSRNPDQYLNPTGKLFINIDYYEPLSITPEIITLKDWPKGQTSKTLKITGKITQRSRYVWGTAKYVVCSKKAKACKTKVSRYSISLI